MIKIENTHVDNIVRSVYSARNAMNSWDKSDSDWNTDSLGENDLKLAKNLSKAGSDHRKFLRMINVTCDITAPRFWWAEYDTYKIGTVANSCSTMHTIHKRPFYRDDFSTDAVNRVLQNRVPIEVEKEEWRETEYEGVYVSNTGRVMQDERDIKRKDGRTIHLPEREIAVTEDDYLRVKLHCPDGSHNCKLHRLMAKAFIPNPNNYPVVNHKDGNKLNCNLDNLEWCTSAYNRQHACDNGLVQWSKESREACGKRSRKFDDEQVQKMKDLKELGFSLTEIANHFGCGISTISRILSGKTYVESKDILDLIIDNLNTLRELYLETDDKDYWRQIIELLPQSYNQRRTVQMNYEVLRNMYYARKGHRLDEWHTFCDWAFQLPYFKEIVLEGCV